MAWILEFSDKGEIFQKFGRVRNFGFYRNKINRYEEMIIDSF